MPFLLVLVVAGPLAAIGLAGAVGGLTWRRARRHALAAADLLLGALAAGCVALLGYAYGVATGDFVYAGSTHQICPDGPLGDPQTATRLLPLAHDCRYADGRTVALVPGLVNPLVLVALLVAGLCLVLGLRARHGRGTGPPGTTPHSPSGSPATRPSRSPSRDSLGEDHP